MKLYCGDYKCNPMVGRCRECKGAISQEKEARYNNEASPVQRCRDCLFDDLPCKSCQLIYDGLAYRDAIGNVLEIWHGHDVVEDPDGTDL